MSGEERRIVSQAEAKRVADAMLADLDRPPVEVSMPWEDWLKEGDTVEWDGKTYRIKDLDRGSLYRTKFTLVRVP